MFSVYMYIHGRNIVHVFFLIFFFIASTCKINVYCHRNLGGRLLSAAATLTGRLWVTSTIVAVSFMRVGVVLGEGHTPVQSVTNVIT